MEENQLNSNNTWLLEPDIIDDTYGLRGEHTLDWLARSTVLRAREARRFLNENVTRLPVEVQQSFRHNLRVRWKTAFFELIVFRVLQELGATISIEQTLSTGKKPDFIAQFPDASIIVEATSPVYDGTAGEVLKKHIPLLNYIESKVPEDWSVLVLSLPDIGLNDSQKVFREVVDGMLSQLTTLQKQERVELSKEIEKGPILLIAWPRKPKWPKILGEAPINSQDNTKNRIQEAVRKKKQQTHKAGLPVLLAIEASGLSSEFEDFDQTLFGYGFDRYNERREFVGVGFKPDGLFNNNRTEPPTYAGVLAFIEVGFREGPAPVLYRHPRFSGVLPEAILGLEQHIYDKASNSIQIIPPKVENLMQKLGFVDRAF